MEEAKLSEVRVPVNQAVLRHVVQSAVRTSYLTYCATFAWEYFNENHLIER